MLIAIIRLIGTLALLWMVWDLSCENSRQYRKIKSLESQIHNQKFVIDAHRISKMTAWQLLREYKLKNPPRNRFVAIKHEEVAKLWFDLAALVLKDVPYTNHLKPCRYCHRFDSGVKHITTDGLNGYYHPFCASEIVRDAREELARRMS